MATICVSRLINCVMFRAIFLLLATGSYNLISPCGSVPLEPGQPGGPWTNEEMGIVRQKVRYSVKHTTKLVLSLVPGGIGYEPG